MSNCLILLEEEPPPLSTKADKETTLPLEIDKALVDSLNESVWESVSEVRNVEEANQ